MGLFDAIERLSATEEQQNTTQGTAPSHTKAAAGLPSTQQGGHHGYTPDTTEEIWRADPEELAKRRGLLQRKPEKLSFLQPCPVCGGREYTHLEGAGFRCRTCQPSGNVGYPVYAAGPDRQERSVDAAYFPAKENIDVAPEPSRERNQPSEEQQSYFFAAWPWIREHKEELTAAGWTMAALVRRAKYRWPIGFGVAWLSVWTRPELQISIGHRGEIIFTFQSSGRTITQTAWPPQRTAGGHRGGQRSRASSSDNLTTIKTNT